MGGGEDWRRALGLLTQPPRKIGGSVVGVSFERLHRLVAVRYAHETGGVTVDGKSLHSDRQSQASLASARMKAKEGKAPSTWKVVE